MIRFFKYLYIILFVVGIKIAGFSQSTVSYTFVSATNASLTDMSSGTTQLIGASIDDGVSSLTSIGFDFFFMGVKYSQFSVNSNGLMRLGGTVISSEYSNNLATAVDLPFIAPFWDDLKTNVTGGKVHYKVTGSDPNRILTIEWTNMEIELASSTADGTFQCRINETTGVIEFVYGAMAIGAGSGTVDASIGFSNASADNSLISVQTLAGPTVLRTTAGVVNTLVNSSAAGAIANLNSAADGSRVKYSFTPLTTSAPTVLSFSGVTASAMTLNWTNNGSNRIVSAIYNSTDNVTFTYVGTAVTGATSYAATALLPSTTYYWKVYSVSEGYLSSALTGTQATTTPAVGATRTWDGGAGTLVWTTAANWSGDVAPVDYDLVVFNTVGTFTITSVPTISLYDLTISNGTVTFSGAATTISLLNDTGYDLTIASSKGLILSGVSITLGTSNTADISGALTITTGTYNTNGISVVTTVSTSGSISNAGTVTCTSTSKLIFEGSSSYTHAQNGGTIPTADWNGATNTATSTCTVTGMTTTKPGGLVTTSNTFYHFIWNCPGQLDYLTSGAQGSIAGSGENFTTLGNFTITNTNGYYIAFSEISGGALSTLTVGGNMAVNDVLGCFFYFNKSSTPVTVNITGDLSIGGSIVYGQRVAAGAATTINIAGSLNLNSGGFRLTYSDYSTVSLNVTTDINITTGSFYVTYSAGTGAPSVSTRDLNVAGGNFYGTNNSGSSAITVTRNVLVSSGIFRGSYDAGSPTYTIAGNVSVTGGTFYGTDYTGSSVFTISGDILISGGTFYGTNDIGDPTFNVRDITISSAGTFIGTSWAGGVPVFNVSRDWSTSGATALVRFSSSSSAGTFAITRNFTVSDGWTTVSYSTGSPTVTVGGNFTVSGGNFAGSEATSGAPTVSITGNFTVSGGTFYGSSWTATGNPIFNITGNSTISSGTFNGTALTGDPTFNMTGSLTTSGTGVFYATTASGGLPIFNIQGSVDLSGGTTAGSSSFASTAPMSTFNLTGASSNNLTLKTGLTYNTTAAWSWNISAGRTITLLSDIEIGGTASSCIFTNNGTLIMGTYKFPAVTTAVASFVNATGSILQTGHLQGLSSTASTGALQLTGTITLSTTASYVFNGVAAQVTGNITPTTVANLTFNNAAGITLSQGVIVANAGTLLLTTGYHDLATYTLQVGTTAATTVTQTAGGLYSTTNNGSFKRYIPAGAVASTGGVNYGLFPFAKSASLISKFELNSTVSPTVAGFITGTPTFTGSPINVNYADDHGTVDYITLKRSVILVSTVTGGTYTLKLTAAILVAGTASDLTLVTYTGATMGHKGTYVANSGTAPNPVLSRTLVTDVDLTAAQTFAIGTYNNGATPLPIQLISFTGEKSGIDNELKWTTASELNNDLFTIERTYDGETFETVGTQNGAGNSITSLDYFLTDYNVRPVVNYYRLKQTDFDGQSTVSEVISIDNSKSNSSKVIVLKTNILGQEVNNNYRGLVVIVYSDGSSVKVIQ